MSFHCKGGPSTRKKVPSQRRPVWDDSVHDLTVYRATPDEILMRKEAHKSKNHMSVKLEQMRKERLKSALTGAEVQQLAIMKEVLYDQQQLQNIVTKSDKMMAAVKDLFADDSKRFTGFPIVTTAPESSLGNNVIAPVPGICTFAEKLSGADMNTSVPKDVDISISVSDEEEEGLDQPATISFESQLNLSKFQNILQEEEQKLDHQDPYTLVAQQNEDSIYKLDSDFKKIQELTNLPSNLLQIINQALPDIDQHSLSTSVTAKTVEDGKNCGLKTPQKIQLTDGQVSIEQKPHSAINDTTKVKKTKKQTSPSYHRNAAHSNRTDFWKALQDLEKELRTYEQQVGPYPPEENDQAQTFSGYTLTLISAVSRLTRYLKETELRLKTEIILREQLTEDVFQLRAIIDALATDIITTQEEYAKLYTENQHYRETTAKITSDLKNEMQQMRALVTGLLSRPANIENAEGIQNEGGNSDKGMESISSRAFSPMNNRQTGANLPSASDQQSSSIKISKEDKSIHTTAIILSPPVRKTRMVKDTKQVTSISAPTVVETINIPRPTPLVQSNLPAELTSVAPSNPDNLSKSSEPECGAACLQDLTELGDQTQEQLNNLQEMTVEEALNNPALQDLIQTQIAELNCQQEEARKRLQDLLGNQKLQQQHLKEQLESNVLLDRKFSPPNGNIHQMPHCQVSPPISPIYQGSGEKFCNNQG